LNITRPLQQDKIKPRLEVGHGVCPALSLIAPYPSLTPPLLKLPVASRICTPLSASPVFWLTTVPSIVAGCAPSNPTPKNINIASFIDGNIAHPAPGQAGQAPLPHRGGS